MGDAESDANHACPRILLIMQQTLSSSPGTASARKVFSTRVLGSLNRFALSPLMRAKRSWKRAAKLIQRDSAFHMAIISPLSQRPMLHQTCLYPCEAWQCRQEESCDSYTKGNAQKTHTNKRAKNQKCCSTMNHECHPFPCMEFMMVHACSSCMMITIYIMNAMLDCLWTNPHACKTKLSKEVKKFQ